MRGLRGPVRLGDVPVYLTDCPFLDWGRVGALAVASGEIVLMCEECGTVWCSPSDIERGRFTQPSEPDWVTTCGVSVRPGTTSWASLQAVMARPELAALTWMTGA